MPKPITKPSAALREAAKLIKDGAQRHTCYALDRLFLTRVISGGAAEACKQYIKTLLGRSSTLEVWLRVNVPKCGRLDLWTVKNYRKVKQTRLAWIDWMAQQFEAQGR